MYRPPHFREERTQVLHAAMAGIGFAALVSQSLDATQMPLLLDADDGALGTLSGHMARANPHWKSAAGEGLAIFLGPHAYVSPNWYPSKAEHGKQVPTWNYIAVHARGVVTVHDDPAWLRGHLEKLTATHEAARPAPWKVSDAPETYIAAQLKGIVGITLRITALEGNWKLSQNKADADFEGVRAALIAQGAAVADLMKPRT